jgi:ribonucleoside-diphosphate reductase alpha chain
VKISFRIAKIRKRDGSLEPFDAKRIEHAIAKAFKAVGQRDLGLSRKLCKIVVEKAEKKFAGAVPGVEDVQDFVEQTLLERRLTKAATAYIVYRRKRAEAREARRILGVRDDLKMDRNAIVVLKSRYLLKDALGRVVETPAQLFKRVAKTIAAVDAKYGKSPRDVRKLEEDFYQAMASREFMPNSPALMNASTPLGQLFACFVLPVEDSLESIFDTLKHAAMIHQSGGGTGFNFSHLRPRGDLVKSTRGVASGPVSFMRIYDMMTEIIKQGGKRRGANMGLLNANHPDVREFIESKFGRNVLRNFNISVAATDEFMRKAEKHAEYELVSPRNGRSAGRLNAGEVLDSAARMAWHTGDPGMIFLDEINRYNPTPHLGAIEATNPCGEVPLLPYEPCVLASINLGRMVDERKRAVDWSRLRHYVRLGVHFLDNTIDANKFPLPEIEKISKGNRRIGLGVMGFADMLVKIGVPYDSEKALKTAETLMKFISDESHKKSVELAGERGSFPNFDGSIWHRREYKAMRNATTTTIAPTGTIGIITGCSSGIEPYFAISFFRNVLEGTKLLEANALFEQVAIQRGFYSRDLMAEIAKRGSVQGVAGVPRDVQRLFVTAFDIAPEWHVKMQAAFQKHTDNAVSKTVNLPFKSTPEEVKKVYLLAWKLKCKGITIFRYGSKEEQVLYVGEVAGKKRGEKKFVEVQSEYAGGPQAGACAGGECVL